MPTASDDDKDQLDRQHGFANAVRQQKQHLRDLGDKLSAQNCCDLMFG